MDNFDVVIIGGGPAGISAAIWCKRLDLDHVLMEASDKLGGQLFEINNEIIDHVGVMAKNGAEFQELLVQQIEALECNVKLGCSIKTVDSNKKLIHYQESGTDRVLSYRYLIMATGAKPRTLGIPGEEAMMNRGEVYSATRDNHLFRSKNVAIVGGGDRAVEGAYLLAEAGATVYLIHRSTQFRARSALQKRAFENKNVQVLTDTRVVEIRGENQVEGIVVEDRLGKRSMDISAVFIRIGVSPNSFLVRDQVAVDGEGYIIVNKVGQTDIPTIYAIGDLCTDPTYSSISSSVGQGVTCVKHISNCMKGTDQ